MIGCACFHRKQIRALRTGRPMIRWLKRHSRSFLSALTIIQISTNLLATREKNKIKTTSNHKEGCNRCFNVLSHNLSDIKLIMDSMPNADAPEKSFVCVIMEKDAHMG